jgi:hypothetical protein
MRVPGFVIPILIVAALVGGYFLRLAFTQPTTSVTHVDTTGRMSVFIVEGLKCRGTASFFSSLYDSIPGIYGIETYATEHKAVFNYNPEMIGRDSIQAIMEAMIPFDDSTSAQVFKCISVE